jgi:hypothetical protein
MENSSPEIQTIVLLASSPPEIFFGFEGGEGGVSKQRIRVRVRARISLGSLSLSFLIACPRPRIHMRFIAFQAPKSAADLRLRGAGIDFFSQ